MISQLRFSILITLLLVACQSKEPEIKEHSFIGQTMGTSYLVMYVGATEPMQLQKKVDSLLEEINLSVSTYIKHSTISKVNNAQKGTIKVDEHFLANFLKAKEVYEKTNGSFNPALMPLVNYYGFGFEKLKKSDNQIDTTIVKQLHLLCDFNNFEYKENRLYKKNSHSQLDFSAIAKGYGVDAVASLIENEGIQNYLVEIGGEAYAQGNNLEGRNWNIAIRKPTIEKKITVVKTFKLNKKAIATSGNYENYRQLQDKHLIGHTINPETGFPQSVTEELLSSSVIAKDCMTADAYATAFKVMGLSESLSLLNSLPELDVYFVYKNDHEEIGIYSSIEE